MKKLSKKPILFGIALLFIFFAFMVLALIVVSIPLSITGYDNLAQNAIVAGLVQIGVVLLMTPLAKKWMDNGADFGFGIKNLGFGCLLLLPMLAESVIYILGGYLGGIFAAEMTLKDVAEIFISGLNPGITEEIMFRGWILVSMLYCWKDKKHFALLSVIVSSLFFSLVHMMNMLDGQSFLMTLNQLAFTLAMGFTMAAAFIRSHNILAPIIFHSFHDIFVLMIIYSLGGTQSESGASLIQLVVYLVLIVYSIYLIRPAKEDEIRKLWKLSPAPVEAE